MKIKKIKKKVGFLQSHNLRDCKYYNDFLSKKIVWSDISREPSFTVDKDNYFLLNTNYFLSTHNKDYPIYYLVGILNSDILYWYFKRICSTLGDTGFRYTKQFVKQLPIPNADKNIKENIIKLSKNISDLYINSKSNEAIELEWDLNRIIYELFNLTEDEIDLIKEELN